MNLNIEIIKAMPSKEYLKNRQEIRKFYESLGIKYPIIRKEINLKKATYLHNYYTNNKEKISNYKKEWYKRRKDELQKLCTLF